MKLFIIASLLVGSAVCGYAQENPSQPVGGPVQLSANATASKGGVMSFEQLLSITKSSVRENIARSLSKVAGDLVNNQVAEVAGELRTGRAVNFSAIINAKENITEQHSINVRASYEARPIGGILNIRVELVPIFDGIGSASRPAISREFTEAIDSFDDDVVSQTVTRLTHELAAEYAARQEVK